MAINNNHYCNHCYILPRAQTGAVLLAMMLVLIVGSAFYLTTKLNTNLVKTQHSLETGIAMKAAKNALIGYAISYPDKVNADEGPGYLPCPDLNNNGSSAGSCSINGTTSIGRFPYKTLEVEELRDGHGERLWYVVSDNFRNNPKMTPLNSETAGNSSGDMTVDGYTNIAAVIFVADVPENNQNRIAANENDYTHYIEATFTDSDGDAVLDSITTAATDRYILLTRDELMQDVEKRVLGEASQFLTTYFNTYGAYPWLTPFADPKASKPVLSGEHDGGDDVVNLSDSSRDFTVWGIAIGDVIRNVTDGSVGTVTVVAATTLTIGGGMGLGTENDFDDDDEYYIYPVALSDTGQLTGTATNVNNNASLEDTNNDFIELEIAIGDIVDNLTDGSSGVVESVSATELTFKTLPNTLTLSGGTENDFDTGDVYRIRNQQGKVTGVTNNLTIDDANNDFVVIGVQAGDLIVNHTDGSSGRVSAVVDADTLTVDELYFGSDNTFEVSDYYSLSRNTTDNISREGLLAFHEVGKHFPTALDIDWDFTTVAAADISFDAVTFPGVQATYSTAITTYLDSYAESAGTQAFDRSIGTCIWLLAEIADCFGSFRDFVNISGRVTSGSNTNVVTDSVAEFNTNGIKRGDITMNYDDEFSVISGTADAGSTGTILVDASADFSVYERYSYLVQNNTLEVDLGVGKIQGVIADIIDANTLEAVSYVGESATPIEFRVGDTYVIYQPRKMVVTSVSSETQLSTDNYTSSTIPDFDTGEYYRVMTAANSFTGTVDDEFEFGEGGLGADLLSGQVKLQDVSADFIAEGVDIGDVIYVPEQGDYYGEILAVTATTITTALHGDGSHTNHFHDGWGYTIFHDYVFSRDHIFHTKFRGTQATNAVSEERVRDVCMGYNADCSATAAAVNFSGNGGTPLITLRDYEEDETTEVGRATFTPTVASSGSIRVSNINYSLFENNGEIPQWFLKNKWHQLIYVTYDDGDSPGGGADCVPISTNALTTNPCVTVTNGGSPNDNKRALVISAGEPLANQDRTSGNMGDYYEFENNDQLVDIDDDNFQTGEITGTFNDQIRVLDTSP